MRTLILALVTVLSAMSNASAACRLSQADREQIKTIGTTFSDSSFQNKVISKSPCCNGIDDGSRFVPTTAISSLTNKRGQLLLFRGIQTNYISKFPSPFAKVEANSYSYSLSPAMPVAWPYTKVVLVAFQNVTADGLMFPMVDFNAERGRSYPLARESTLTGDIAQFDEIKVPINNEKVLFQIEASNFREIVDSFQNSNYSLNELLLKALESPTTKSVNCRD